MKVFSLIKKCIRDYAVQLKVLRRPSIRYCIENELLPSLITRTSSDVVRNIFNLPDSEYSTQLNQDIFALLVNQFNSGFFLEIGANDGFDLSNTVYLEQNFGWRGILIEANKKYVASLVKRKRSVVVNKAVSSCEGIEEFIDAGLYGGLKASLDNMHDSYTKDAPSTFVECMALQEILDDSDAPEQIDFISIDVEGGEVPIVEQMVSVNRRFRCGCIEYNMRIDDYYQMVSLLEEANYKVVWKNQTEHDLFFIDGHAN